MTKRKLNLGCGRCYLPSDEGWINVDYFSNTKADAYHDVANLPYSKESFSLVYCSHLIEHLHRFAIVAVLNHWKSLLEPGGILRLAVPNFEAICEHYIEHRDLKVLMGLLYGGQTMDKNNHNITFDRKYLTELLTQAGFVNVEPWDWRNTEHSAFDDYSRAVLPHMDFENGKLMSLNLQASKP